MGRQRQTGTAARSSWSPVQRLMFGGWARCCAHSFLEAADTDSASDRRRQQHEAKSTARGAARRVSKEFSCEDGQPL